MFHYIIDLDSAPEMFSKIIQSEQHNVSDFSILPFSVQEAIYSCSDD